MITAGIYGQTHGELKNCDGFEGNHKLEGYGFEGDSPPKNGKKNQPTL